jgi:glycosyltransferase involved in cell wall biosynthesis
MISFLSVFPPFRGGISRFSHHLHEALRERHTTHAFNFTHLYPPVLFPGTSQMEADPGTVYAKPVLHAYQPLNWRGAAVAILKKRPQLLIYSHWHPFFAPALTGVVRAMKERRPSLDVVGLLHNVEPHERFPFQKTLTRRLLGLTDIPVVLSSQTEGEYRDWMPGRRPVRLFHPVYDQNPPEKSVAELRRKHGFAGTDRVLLFFGFIREYKGLDVLIEALNLLDLQALRIRPLIVGEFYIDKNALLRRIRNDHLPYYEIIDRYVSQSEAAEYLALSDAMMLPYRSASQSGILSNAVNFHLPVVCADLPGLTDHIADGVNGLVHRREDPIDLARAITQFVKTANVPAMREAMKGLKSRLGWDAFARDLLAAAGMG